MKIQFHKIRWMNFLSTGNEWTEIDLESDPSVLIIGVNGSGKSTLLDALSFGLFGKPYRTVNKPLLVNSIIGKKAMVEIEFRIGNSEYTVRRGIKPNVFEIHKDGKMIDQDADAREYQSKLEDNILQMNHKSFCQIVMIGSANFTPFMQLKAQERREVIEDLLDIQVFSRMSDILKGYVSKNKKLINDTSHEYEMHKREVELTRQHINEIRSLKQNNVESKREKIDELRGKIEDIQRDVDTFKKQVEGEKSKAKVTKLQELVNKRSDVQTTILSLKSKKHELGETIRFFEDQSECPTCGQEIDDDFCGNEVRRHKKKVAEIESALKDKLVPMLDKLADKIEQIEKVNKNIRSLEGNISDKERHISMYDKEIRSIEQSIKEDASKEDESKHIEKMEELESKVKKADTKLSKAKDFQEVFDVATKLLKDNGIKARIIRQYIPVINKMMNKYLSSLDFFVQFELDENFGEKIRSRHRDEFVYESFSEGEKMRIDLAILMTWRAVSKMRNSTTTNILVLDEVFDSSLDVTGTDELLRILTQLSEGTNVFVISHKGEQLHDKFHRTLQFEKIKNFSKVTT